MTRATAGRGLASDARRQREVARELLAQCRRELREALSGPEPDPGTVLELSVEERLLRERLALLPLPRSVVADHPA
jgi:hypothetical protein